MLLSNVPFVLAYALPKQTIAFMQQQGFDTNLLPEASLGHTSGVIAGVIFFAILALVSTMFPHRTKRKNSHQSYTARLGSDQEPSMSSQDSRLNINLDGSDDEPVFGDDITYNNRGRRGSQSHNQSRNQYAQGVNNLLGAQAGVGPNSRVIAAASANADADESGSVQKKGFLKKGKKGPQSASALHLRSQDNPLNLRAARINAQKAQAQDREQEPVLKRRPSNKSVGINPAQDQAHRLSLRDISRAGRADSDASREPTLSSDLFTNNLKSGANDRGMQAHGADSTLHGSATMPFGLDPKNKTAQLTLDQKRAAAAAAQAQQGLHDLSQEHEPQLEESALEGNKVSDILDALEQDPSKLTVLNDKARRKRVKAQSQSQFQSSSHDDLIPSRGFADILNSAQDQDREQQSLAVDPVDSVDSVDSVDGDDTETTGAELFYPKPQDVPEPLLKRLHSGRDISSYQARNTDELVASLKDEDLGLELIDDDDDLSDDQERNSLRGLSVREIEAAAAALGKDELDDAVVEPVENDAETDADTDTDTDTEAEAETETDVDDEVEVAAKTASQAVAEQDDAAESVEPEPKVPAPLGGAVAAADTENAASAARDAKAQKAKEEERAAIEEAARKAHFAFEFEVKPKALFEEMERDCGYKRDLISYSFTIETNLPMNSRPYFSVEGFMDGSSYVEQSHFTATFHESDLQGLLGVSGSAINRRRGGRAPATVPVAAAAASAATRSRQDTLQKSTDEAQAKAQARAQAMAQSQSQAQGRGVAATKPVAKEQQVLEIARNVARDFKDELDADSAAAIKTEKMQQALREKAPATALEAMQKSKPTLPYALSSKHTDANQDEAMALAAILQQGKAQQQQHQQKQQQQQARIATANAKSQERSAAADSEGTISDSVLTADHTFENLDKVGKFDVDDFKSSGLTVAEALARLGSDVLATAAALEADNKRKGRLNKTKESAVPPVVTASAVKTAPAPAKIETPEDKLQLSGTMSLEPSSRMPDNYNQSLGLRSMPLYGDNSFLDHALSLDITEPVSKISADNHKGSASLVLTPVAKPVAAPQVQATQGPEIKAAPASIFATITAPAPQGKATTLQLTPAAAPAPHGDVITVNANPSQSMDSSGHNMGLSLSISPAAAIATANATAANKQQLEVRSPKIVAKSANSALGPTTLLQINNPTSTIQGLSVVAVSATAPATADSPVPVTATTLSTMATTKAVSAPAQVPASAAATATTTTDTKATESAIKESSKPQTDFSTAPGLMMQALKDMPESERQLKKDQIPTVIATTTATSAHKTTDNSGTEVLAQLSALESAVKSITHTTSDGTTVTETSTTVITRSSSKHEDTTKAAEQDKAAVAAQATEQDPTAASASIQPQPQSQAQFQAQTKEQTKADSRTSAPNSDTKTASQPAAAPVPVPVPAPAAPTVPEKTKAAAPAKNKSSKQKIELRTATPKMPTVSPWAAGRVNPALGVPLREVSSAAATATEQQAPKNDKTPILRSVNRRRASTAATDIDNRAKNLRELRNRRRLMQAKEEALLAKQEAEAVSAASVAEEAKAEAMAAKQTSVVTNEKLEIKVPEAVAETKVKFATAKAITAAESKTDDVATTATAKKINEPVVEAETTAKSVETDAALTKQETVVQEQVAETDTATASSAIATATTQADTKNIKATVDIPSPMVVTTKLQPNRTAKPKAQVNFVAPSDNSKAVSLADTAPEPESQESVAAVSATTTTAARAITKAQVKLPEPIELSLSSKANKDTKAAADAAKTATEAQEPSSSFLSHEIVVKAEFSSSIGLGEDTKDSDSIKPEQSTEESEVVTKNETKNETKSETSAVAETATTTVSAAVATECETKPQVQRRAHSLKRRSSHLVSAGASSSDGAKNETTVPFTVYAPEKAEVSVELVETVKPVEPEVRVVEAAPTASAAQATQAEELMQATTTTKPKVLHSLKARRGARGATTVAGPAQAANNESTVATTTTTTTTTEEITPSTSRAADEVTAAVDNAFANVVADTVSTPIRERKSLKANRRSSRNAEKPLVLKDATDFDISTDKSVLDSNEAVLASATAADTATTTATESPVITESTKATESAAVVVTVTEPEAMVTSEGEVAPVKKRSLKRRSLKSLFRGESANSTVSETVVETAAEAVTVPAPAAPAASTAPAAVTVAVDSMPEVSVTTAPTKHVPQSLKRRRGRGRGITVFKSI